MSLNFILPEDKHGSSVNGSVGIGEVSPGSSYYLNMKSWVDTLTPPEHTWKPMYQGKCWDQSTEIKFRDNSPITRIGAYLARSVTVEDGSIVLTGNWAVGNIANVEGWDDVAKTIRNEITTNNYLEKVEQTHTNYTSSGSTTNITQRMNISSGYSIDAPPSNGRQHGEFNYPFYIFSTKEELETYLRTGEGTPLNADAPIVLPDYDYYVYNMITTSLGSGTDAEYYYRFKMNPNGRLAFYKSNTAGNMYDRVLVGLDGVQKSYVGEGPDYDLTYVETMNPQMYYLGNAKRMESGTTYYPLMYQTNINTFDTKEHADAYILSGDETGIIDKWRTDDVQPGEIGDPTDTTEQGENGAVFSYGGGMFRLSNAQLASFYAEAFNTDPNVMQSILEGLQLYGSNQINAIHDVMYIPFNAEHVATLSSGNDIYLGSYKMTTVQGDRVLKNDKLINMGTHYFAPPYGAGDHRNYAPLCRIFVMLPYAGTHELQIDKYIGKNITIKLAVDLTTGAGTYFIFSNNTIMDSFDCQIGAHRPITAVDHAQQVSAATNAILQTGTQGIKTVAGATNAINPAQAATAGREATKTSLNAAGLGGVVGGAIGTVVTGYQGMQSTIDYPMTERGSFNGFLGMFDVKSPYFVFCQMKTKQAQNLITVMGKPSAAGGKLSSFFGYFEAAAVDLPSFSGTEAEAEELMSILKGGIYID